jgi:methylglutaconyl-CoA hydratase
MSFLKITYDTSWVKITLNNPEKRNALNAELMTELTDFFVKTKEDLKSFKYVLLEGEGKSFCAGADLNWMKEMVNYSFEENVADSEKLFNLFNSIYTFDLPVIVKAHGHVFGGGLGLLAAADFAVAHEETKFCFSEVKLGLAPAVISSFVLSKCNMSHAQAYMLSGKAFGALKAYQIGLINHLHHKDHFKELLESFDQSSQEALIATKKLILAQRPLKPEEHKKMTMESISKLRTSEQAQNRMLSFLSHKSAPKSRGQ